MAPPQLTVEFKRKSLVALQSHHKMTRTQRDQSLLSVESMSRALRNIVHHLLASINTVQALLDRLPEALTCTHQVVLGLATLQSAVQDLSHKYIAHTNTVIGRGPGAQPDLLNVNYLSGQPLFANRAATPAANTNANANAEGGETKKRKRAPHDKNAPKRPVTPYFLYMQTARAIIANEMPPGSHPKEVAEEGTRRWLTMPEDEKNVSILVRCGS